MTLLPCTLFATTFLPCDKRDQARNNLACAFLFYPVFARKLGSIFLHPNASRTFGMKPRDIHLTARRFFSFPTGSCARLAMLPPDYLRVQPVRYPVSGAVCCCFLPVVSTPLPLPSAIDTLPLGGVINLAGNGTPLEAKDTS